MNSWTSIVCAYDINAAGKYKKTKTSNFYEKCNAYVCKNCFERCYTRSPPKGNRLYDIFAMEVPFSGLYFLFRVFLLISYLLEGL